MGKEKRLFLLAVMTVMMSTVGYGVVIDSPEKSISVKQDEKYEIINETKIKGGKTVGIIVEK